MTLRQLIALRCDGTVNWTSPSGPDGSDWRELFVGMQVIPSSHPPSLKNPQKVKLPSAQDGWKQGDSKKARQQAIDDLRVIHERLLRMGKPTVVRQANYPGFPSPGTNL